MPFLFLLLLAVQPGGPKYKYKLIRAMEDGDVARVQELFKDGADPNIRLDDQTLLVHAVRGGNPAMVRAFLAAGALKMPVPGNRCLIAALESDRFDIAQLLIQEGFRGHVPDRQKWSPLALAIDRKAYALYRDLIKADMPVNQVLVEGNTALHFAVMHDDVWAAACLVLAGGDPHKANDQGMTPAQIVLERQHQGMLQLFNTGRYERPTHLAEAAYLGDLVRVVDLLQKGTNINAALPNGMTALMASAAIGDLKAMQFLVAKGADMEARDVNGLTALMYAAQNGRTAAMLYLLDAGADLQAQDARLVRPLGHALARWDLQMTHLLAERGARVFCRTNKDHEDDARTMSEGRTVRLSEVIHAAQCFDPWSEPARVSVRTEPQFPAQGDAIEGRVILRVAISDKGVILDQETLAVTGNVPRRFGRVARKAVANWQFKPATRHGQAMTYIATVVLEVRTQAS